MYQILGDLNYVDDITIDSQNCEKAFDLLKERLVSYPILRQPDPEKQFLLFRDASGFALGAILSQVDENNYEYVCACIKKIKRSRSSLWHNRKGSIGSSMGHKIFQNLFIWKLV